MKSLAVLVVLTIISSSCTIQGLTNDYNKLNENQKAKVLPLIDFDHTQSGIVYKINGSQLREELLKYPKSLVYIFSSGCSSEHCKPLMTYKSYAEFNGYKLFLVMTGYMDFDKTIEQDIPGPLYVIDNQFYNKVIRNNYVSYFENDLLDQPLKADDEYLGSLYFFKYGRLEKITRDLPENSGTNIPEQIR